VTDTPVANDATVRAAIAAIDAWIAAWSEDGSFLELGERHPVTDGTATWQWYLRFRGEEKDAITVWATLNQRTLHTEVQLMPAPDANAAEVYAYLLAANASLYGMAYAIGPEGAIYLVGRTAVGAIDEATLDRIFGTAVVAVDAVFPHAMTLAYPELYRRRRRREGSGRKASE
jgi:hypothetical protein